jgi:squalene-hopene/tetraprenyl-beta-curcumene cyclase
MSRVILCFALLAGGCAPASTDARETPLTRGRAWLLAHGHDGVWRSEVYTPFRDGPSLTPLVLLALQESGDPADCDYLARLARADGSIDAGRFGINYPVYTCALTVRVLCNSPKHRAARDASLAELRRRQLDESNGWATQDEQYGGWGYCHAVPAKPKPGEFAPPLLESNLSATVYALDALHAAGVPADDPAFKRALAYVITCQNCAEESYHIDPEFDDGGFFFIADDPARNKAGPLGQDTNGRERFRSYGSTTADGYRALRRCGLPADHPRLVVALNWLRKHFDGKTHPGDYPPERAGDKDAVYFYYAWSLAQSLDEVPREDARRWAGALAAGLIARQRPDGSWSNPCKAVREDDPILATAFAVAALARCQRVR